MEANLERDGNGRRKDELRHNDEVTLDDRRRLHHRDRQFSGNPNTALYRVKNIDFYASTKALFHGGNSSSMYRKEGTQMVAEEMWNHLETKQKSERCGEIERDRTYWKDQWARGEGWREEGWRCRYDRSWG